MTHPRPYRGHSSLRAPRPHRQMQARFFVASDGLIVEKAPPLTADERLAIYKRDGYRCTYCSRRVLPKRTRFAYRDDYSPGAVDHVFPRARGGQNDSSNLVLSCQGCNSAKGAR